MIGGVDIELPTWAGESSLERTVRVIRQFWPDAVFEDATIGDRYAGFEDIPFGATREIFVYRDAKSADGWDAKGAVPSLYNTMVHVITDPGFVTIVVDVRDEFTRRLTQAISSALGDDLSCSVALPEAA